ncbi:MAG: type VI secretion system contractile sheath large subunit [Candidatus Thiodiazotropha sp.]
MAERMTMTFDLGKPGQARPRPDRASHILVVLGDFLGSGSELPAPARPRRVEIETLDTLMAQWQPSIPRPGSSAPSATRINFTRLDDFHPDNLVRELPEPAAAEASPESAQHAEPLGLPPTESDATHESDQQTLSRLLGSQPLGMSAADGSKTGHSRKQQSLIDSVVQKLTEKAALEAPADQPGNRSSIEDGLQADNLRRLLQDPGLRRLEACWRSLDWLLRNNPLDTECPVYLLNFPAAGETAEVDQGDAFDHAVDVLHQQLSHLDPSENRLILILDHCFKPTAEDITRLQRLGLLAQQLGAMLVSAADSLFSELQQDSESGQSWANMRNQEISAHMMLSLPRLLLRLPYGNRYEPIEHFAFEEWTGPADTEKLTWGNPAYALALILLCEWMDDRSFEERRFLDWPAFAYPDGDEMGFQPATESLYTEQTLQTLLSLGLTPAIGSRRQNSVQFPWLQTLKNN